MDENDRHERVKKLRADIRKLAKHSSGKSEHWGSYRKDAKEYVSGAFSFAYEFPDAEKSLRELFDEKRREGKHAYAVDICGIADAKSLGADHTFCLTLRMKSTQRQKSETRTIFEGNIFDPLALRLMLKEFENRKCGPSCVFFNPVGGLLGIPAETRDTATQVLVKHFDAVYDVLEPGGHIYIQFNPFFLHEREKEQFIEHVSKKPYARLEEGRHIEFLRVIKGRG